MRTIKSKVYEMAFPNRDSYNKRKRKSLKGQIRKRLKTIRFRETDFSNYHCPYCSLELKKEDVTLDHVWSEVNGGLYNDLDNTVFCCYVCNQQKEDKLPLDFIWEIVSNVSQEIVLS